MSIPTRLEAYLNHLNKSLGPISLSERSDIITEIKSHVLDAMEKDPSRSLENLLQSLGEPEQVANRYLLERGLKPSKPPKRPMLQWLVIGAVSTFALVLLFVTIMVLKFTPLIEVNEKEERVRLLGGLIDVNGTSGTLKMGESLLNFDEGGHEFSGERLLKKSGLIEIPFSNGKVELQTSDSQQVSWKCKSFGLGHEQTKITDDGPALVLDFSGVKGVKCNIRVPAESRVSIRGSNGKVSVEEPKYHLDLKLDNGSVDIEPKSDTEYAYVTKVVNGHIDQFESSAAKTAYKISVDLVNGKISKN
jgi:hypothetical protein